MEVLRTNFQEVLPQVRKSIEEASVLAFDCEMTGIEAQAQRISPLDDVADRYAKYQTTASRFLVIQFGLSCFKWNAEQGHYETSAYTFYVFPRPSERQGLDTHFTCQASSVDFLCKHDMDWNKVIKHGISYVTKPQEGHLRARLNLDQAQKGNQNEVVLSEKDKEFVDTIFKDIDEWLASSRDMVRTPLLNGYQRKITYQEIEKRYKGTVMVETENMNGSKKPLIVRRPDVQHQADRQREAEAALESAIGFRRVVEAMAASKKPIVGHNMFLDLAFTYSQFMSPLSDDVETFKNTLNDMFPYVYDTKYMATTHPFIKEHIASTVLGDMLPAANNAEHFPGPTIVFAPGMEGYMGEAALLHDAGCDAYITGLCFLKFAHKIAGDMHEGDVVTSSGLSDYANRVFLMRTDIPYLYLAGPDPVPDRTTFFFISDFPKEWKNGHIVAAFKAIGDIEITWVDDISAIVNVLTHEKAAMVLPHFEGVAPKQFSIVDHATYLASKTGERSSNTEKQTKRPRISL